MTSIQSSALSRGKAAFYLAQIQEAIHKATYDATPTQARTYFVDEGADPKAPEGLVHDWLEIRFPELQGCLSISESMSHIVIRISATDPDGQAFRLIQDLPSSLRYLEVGAA